MKRCSTLLIIREIQIKTTTRYHLSLVRMAIIRKSVSNKCWRRYGEKGIFLCCWRVYKLVKSLHRFLYKLKIELTFDPATSLLGMCPEKMKTLIWKHTCIPMLIATVFTTAKTWKQSKWPLTDEWRKKRCAPYHRILFSHKKEWNNSVWSNMDGPRDYHTKWNKSDRERQMSYDSTSMWNLKKWYKWT